jgi:sugar lactone lactonase YvrE
MWSSIIVMAVRWCHRLHAPAPVSIAPLLAALLATAGPGEAVTLNPGDILVAVSFGGITRVNPIDGAQTPAADALYLPSPLGIAIAANGDLFVVDQTCCGGNGGVVRVNPADGNQTVVAAAGNFHTPWGIAIAATGDLFVTDESCCGGGGAVIRVDPTNPDLARNQSVVSVGGHPRFPQGVAVAANGDLFVAYLDVGGQRAVIRVDPTNPDPDTNHAVVSVGGHLGFPQGIAIAANGDLFVGDSTCCGGKGGVIRVDPANPNPQGNQTVVSSGQHFSTPNGIAIAANGDLMVIDSGCCSGNGGVIRVNPAKPANANQTVVSSGGNFASPSGIAIVPERILVTNYAEGGIVVVNPVNAGQSVIASGGHLVAPTGIAIAGNGDVFVSDQGCCAGGTGGVVRVDPADGQQTVVAQGGNFSGISDFAFGIAIAPTGDLFVTSSNCCGVPGEVGVIRVNPADPDLAINQTVVAKGGQLGVPIGIAIAGNGDLLVADVEGVIRVNPANPDLATNQTMVSTGQHFSTPSGIAIGMSGDLFVIDSSCCGGQGGVIRVNPVNGNPNDNQTVVSAGHNFSEPSGIAIGANGHLLVTDPMCCGGQGGVIRVDPVDGRQAVVAQGDKVGGAYGIAIAPLSSGLSLQPPSSCGGDVPCACGDRVVRHRTLRGSDLVTRTPCPADGLVVAAGVTLDLGGATLRGQGAGSGVRIEAGASGVTVRRGTIAGFATGVSGERTTAVRLANLSIFDSAQDGVILTGDGHTIEIAAIHGNGEVGVAVVGTAGHLSRLHVRGNGGAGVRVLGSHHTVEQSAIQDNAGPGAEVSGDANQVALLQVTGNGAHGVLLSGRGNRAARISATRNGGDGLQIHGASATVESNRATNNREAGLEIHGTEHTVRSNIAGQNVGTGLQMLGATGSRFERNRGENNGGFGVTDDSTGTGTSGTANTYIQNICGRGNAAGASWPAGLCR